MKNCGLFSFGLMNYNQLGKIRTKKNNNNDNNENDLITIPKKILLPKTILKIKKISCGSNHTLILSEEGKIFSFGSSKFIGRNNNPLKIYQISHIKENITNISTGKYFSIAYNKYSIYFWGLIYYNENIQNHCEYEKFPKKIYFKKYLNFNKNKFIKKIICGSNHCLILTNKGKIFSFGDNSYGQKNLDPFYYNNNNNLNINKFIISDVDDIFTGNNHSFCIQIIDKKKVLKSWGKNNYGQLGNNSICDSFIPKKVVFKEYKCINNNNNIEIEKIIGGENFSVCLTKDKKIFFWGKNNNNNINKNIIKVPKLIYYFNNKEIEDIINGDNFFYCISNIKNKIYSWGEDDNYLLGAKNIEKKTNPTIVVQNFFKNKKIEKIDFGESFGIVYLNQKNKINNNNNNK
jgi:E3 ubiquitin-protein ligase HERC4